MSYSRLLRDRRIKKETFSRKQVETLVELARRDLESSLQLLKTDRDWSFVIVYNAMLQVARALMFHRGYRPIGQGQHAAVIEFTRLTLGSEFKETLDLMDRMRRKRHRAVYDLAGTISERECKDAQETASRFVSMISEMLV
jgi:uncharacterized protein (UPF0332 family)